MPFLYGEHCHDSFLVSFPSHPCHAHTGRLDVSKESQLPGSHEIDKESDRGSINTMSFKPPKYGLAEDNHGSMYLKMGAVGELLPKTAALVL